MVAVAGQLVAAVRALGRIRCVQGLRQVRCLGGIRVARQAAMCGGARGFIGVGAVQLLRVRIQPLAEALQPGGCAVFQLHRRAALHQPAIAARADPLQITPVVNR